MMSNGAPHSVPGGSPPGAPLSDLAAAGYCAATAVDTTVADPARRYNYWLGGKDHFQVDRISGDAIAAEVPSIRAAAWDNRAFLGRAVSYLAAEAGIDQFLDIGTGLPAVNSTHEVAHRINPHARIAYVDNSPLVLVHARALLTGTAPGQIAYLDADLRAPQTILTSPELRRVIDFGRPVGLLLVAILHFIAEADDPAGLVGTYLDALPPGSCLVLSHATGDHMAPDIAEKATAAATRDGGTFQLRNHDQIAAFFDGLEFVEPGLVSVTDWRPEDETADDAARVRRAREASIWAGVARKP